MKANILDFDGSGRAIIELQRYNNISILENFGFSRLKDVERDIERADTPERTEFLRRYIKAYKESFRSLPQSYICEPEDYNSDVEMCDQSSVCFHNVKLLHSSAWYVYGRVPVEIAAVKKHLTELQAGYVAVSSIDKVVQAIRIASTPKEAVANLQKEFKLTKVQASFLVDLPLSRLTSFTKEDLDKEKADYKQRLLFLKKLL